MRYFKREGERKQDHIHIHKTFITEYYYNSSILLLGIVVNSVLCLISKLNFITGMYV